MTARTVNGSLCLRVILVALLVCLSFSPFSFNSAKVAQAAPNEPISVNFNVASAIETADPAYNGMIYSLADVTVGGTDGIGNPIDIASLTISHPAELQIVAPLTLPSGWAATIYGGGTSTSYNIAAPATDGTSAQVAAFLLTVTFGLVTVDVLPADATAITVEIDKDDFVSWVDSNGRTHYFEYVSAGSNISWVEAYNAAKASSHNGLRGYLATITSQAEADLVFTYVSSQAGWTGGTRARLDLGGGTYSMLNNELTISAATLDITYGVGNPANEWYWACGPEAGTVYYSQPVYTGALNNDPPDTGVVAGVYSSWRRGLATSTNEPNDNLGVQEAFMQAVAGVNEWNDLPLTSTAVAGYFVEYGGFSDDPFTPADSRKVGLIPAPVIVSYVDAADGSILKSEDVYYGTFGYTYDSSLALSSVAIPAGLALRGVSSTSAPATGQFSGVTQYVEYEYAPPDTLPGTGVINLFFDGGLALQILVLVGAMALILLPTILFQAKRKQH